MLYSQQEMEVGLRKLGHEADALARPHLAPAIIPRPEVPIDQAESMKPPSYELPLTAGVVQFERPMRRQCRGSQRALAAGIEISPRRQRVVGVQRNSRFFSIRHINLQYHAMENRVSVPLHQLL